MMGGGVGEGEGGGGPKKISGHILVKSCISIREITSAQKAI